MLIAQTNSRSYQVSLRPAHHAWCRPMTALRTPAASEVNQSRKWYGASHLLHNAHSVAINYLPQLMWDHRLGLIIDSLIGFELRLAWHHKYWRWLNVNEFMLFVVCLCFWWDYWSWYFQAYIYVYLMISVYNECVICDCRGAKIFRP